MPVVLQKRETNKVLVNVLGVTKTQNVLVNLGPPKHANQNFFSITNQNIYQNSLRQSKKIIAKRSLTDTKPTWDEIKRSKKKLVGCKHQHNWWQYVIQKVLLKKWAYPTLWELQTLNHFVVTKFPVWHAILATFANARVHTSYGAFKLRKISNIESFCGDKIPNLTCYFGYFCKCQSSYIWGI